MLVLRGLNAKLLHSKIAIKIRLNMKQQCMQKIQEYGKKPSNLPDIENLIQDNTLLAIYRNGKK